MSKSFDIKIYDKYIFKQVTFATIGAIILFTVVWIAPEMLLNTIKDVLSGTLTVKQAVLVLTYELPKILGKAFPVGLLLGTLFTFDKLSKDFELTIFRAIGLSFWRIIAPVLVLSAIVTVFCFITYDKLIPWSVNNLNDIKHLHRGTQYIYTKKDSTGHPTYAVIVSLYYKKSLYDVIVLDFSEKKFEDLHALSHIYVGKTGKNFDDKWTLYDVTAYKISNDGIFENIKSMDEMDILEGEAAKNAFILMDYSVKRDREITNKNLKNYVRLLKQEELDEEYRFMFNKYLQRFFHPFVCVILAVMGCLLGFSKPREQRLVGFTIAIGCIFLYYITLPFFDLLAEKGVLHPFLTAAIPPLAFLGATYAFYKSKDL